MLIELLNYKPGGKKEERTFTYDIDKSLTLVELMNQLAETNKDIDFGPNGYEIDHYLCLDGNRIIRANDDVSKYEKIVVVPFVDGG